MGSSRLSPLHVEIGHRLRRLREEQGLQPIDVFDATVMTVDELLGYESGTLVLKAPRIIDLCEFYGASRHALEDILRMAMPLTAAGRILGSLMPGYPFT